MIWCKLLISMANQDIIVCDTHWLYQTFWSILKPIFIEYLCIHVQFTQMPICTCTCRSKNLVILTLLCILHDMSLPLQQPWFYSLHTVGHFGCPVHPHTDLWICVWFILLWVRHHVIFSRVCSVVWIHSTHGPSFMTRTCTSRAKGLYMVLLHSMPIIKIDMSVKAFELSCIVYMYNVMYMQGHYPGVALYTTVGSYQRSVGWSWFLQNIYLSIICNLLFLLTQLLGCVGVYWSLWQTHSN